MRMPTARRRPRSSVTIEPPRPDDLGRLVHLAWTATHQLVPAPFLEHAAHAPGEFFRVVRDAASGRVLAFLVAATHPAGDGHIFLLCVDPEFRDRGLRRALLRSLQERLREEGERYVAIDVPVGEADTLSLLRREGFRPLEVEPRTRSTGGDHVVMARAIA